MTTILNWLKSLLCDTPCAHKHTLRLLSKHSADMRIGDNYHEVQPGEAVCLACGATLTIQTLNDLLKARETLENSLVALRQKEDQA